MCKKDGTITLILTLISATPIAIFPAFYASHHPVIIFNTKKYPHFNLCSQSEDYLLISIFKLLCER